MNGATIQRIKETVGGSQTCLSNLVVLEPQLTGDLEFVLGKMYWKSTSVLKYLMENIRWISKPNADTADMRAGKEESLDLLNLTICIKNI